MRSLIPLLQVLGDFFTVVTHDDSKDIMTFASATHTSHFHHYQWGVMGKSLTDTAIGLINFMDKLRRQEEHINKQLKQIIASENYNEFFRYAEQEIKKDREARRQFDQERISKLKDYWDFVKDTGSGNHIQNEILRMGNLDQIRVRRKPPIPALPSKIPQPPRLRLP